MSPHLHALVGRLGLTLAHFLWQGTLIAGALGLLLWMLQGRSPRLRYGLACAALALMVLAPLGTWIHLEGEANRHAPTVGAFTLTKLGSEGLEAIVIDTQSRSRVTNVAVLLWSLGVAALSLRLAGSWAWVQWLRRRRTTVPASEALQLQLRRLCTRMGLHRPIRLLICTRVPGPTVLGWLRPVILIPPAALTGLSPDQLEWILAHEVAHVLRHDFAVNLVQSCVEVLLFYHPAVWWVSAKIRQERELCCDDLAVKVSGDALDYAAALTHLEALSLRVAHPSRAADPLALAATGGSFMHRIQRLISPANPAPLAPRAGLILLLLAGAGLGLQARRPAAAPSQTTPVKRLTIDLHQVDLVNVLRLVAESAHLNLVVAMDVKGTGDFQFTDTPWTQILDATLKPAGYAWEMRNGILHVARASALHERVRLTEAILKAQASTSDYTGRKVTLDLRSVPISDLLQRLAADGGVTLTIDPKVQGIYSFRFTDTPWDQILDIVLLTAHLDWEMRNGTLHVFAKDGDGLKK